MAFSLRAEYTFTTVRYQVYSQIPDEIKERNAQLTWSLVLVEL